jgi:prevent-host-death family protein
MRSIVTAVDIQELQENASELIDRAEQGEAITVTRHGRPVARIVSAAMPTHLGVLVAEGAVRARHGPRYLPTPIKLRGSGQSAVHYVAESRR